MTWTPVMARELRVRSRRRSTYRVRFATAFLSIAASVLLMATVTTGGANTGGRLFLVLASSAFVFSLLEGLRYTVDCISEEKREGTIGLLFLTPLTGFGIVTGKLFARSLNSLYALLGTAPALAVPLLLGGVTFGEFSRLLLVLVNTLFASAALGMAVSSFHTGERSAWLVGLVLLGLWLVFPMLSSLSGSPVLGMVASLSPTAPFRALWESSYVLGREAFWMAMASVHGVSWLLLLFAARTVARSWQDDQRLWKRRRKATVAPTRSVPADVRARMLDLNPIFWLASRDSRQYHYIRYFTAAVLIIQLIAVWVAAGAGSVIAPIIPITFASFFILKLWAGVQACSCFVQARRNGAFDMWRATGLSGQQIVRGNWMAQRRFFLLPALLLAIGPFLLALVVTLVRDSLSSSWGNTTVRGPFLLLTAPATAQFAFWTITFLLDLLAVIYLAMYFALYSKQPSRATGYTLLFAAISPIAFAMIFCIPNFVIDLLLCWWSKGQIDRFFRPPQPYSRPPAKGGYRHY